MRSSFVGGLVAALGRASPLDVHNDMLPFLRTDAAAYEVIGGEQWVGLEVPDTFTNRAGATLYAGGCRGVIAPVLDRRAVARTIRGAYHGGDSAACGPPSPKPTSMPGQSPSETFAEAQEAMRVHDWESFFGCLSRSSLVKIVRNGLALALQQGAEDLASGLAAAGGPGGAHWLDDWRDRQEQILRNAQLIWSAAPGSPEQAEASDHHRDLVTDDQAKTEAAISASDRLPVFAAALERRARTTLGGGSVSSTLFVDETLGEVVQRGSRAKSVRVLAGGHEEEIKFERQDGLWYIRLP